MSDTRIKVLGQVWSQNKPSLGDIAEKVDTSRENVRKHCKKLEEKGLIVQKKTGQTYIREVTDEGESRLKDELSDPSQVDTSGQDHDPYFVHFFEIICRFDDADFLPEDWREQLMEIEELDVSEQRDFGSVQVKSRKWVYRLTGRSLSIKLRNELTGEDPRSVKDRAWDKAVAGLDFLEDKLGLSIPRERLELKVKTQHIGARRKNLFRAFAKHIDDHTELDARDMEVRDEEGLLRLYVDRSGPGDLLEGEAGNGGRKNGRRDTAEDDQALLELVTRRMLENPESAERIIDQPSRVDSLEEHAEDVKNTVEKQGSELRSAGEALNRIQDNREAERDTRDAFMEQVRSINNLAQGNQRVLEKIQEGRERDREIIERQESQIEKQGEIIEALQQELEDLRDSKSLEQRVRDRFEKASGFSTVHEHSNPGNRSLYVWDYSTGESPEYRKVLDESMRDRPLVQVSSRDSGGGVVHG